MARRRKNNASSDSPGGAFRRALTPDEVRSILGTGRSPELLRALGLVTERGGASPSGHRKIKQITHFLRLVEPALDDVFGRHEAPILVDAAAGKAYLGLVLYELLLASREGGSLVCVEERPDLAARVESIAERMGYERIDVKPGRIQDVELPERAHFTLALHACDTATDAAIVAGIRSRSDHVAVVPCCQAEVARQLGALAEGGAIRPLWGTAWHRREFGAHLTNVIRTLALRAHGYAVTVTELAGWEHSVKNELILARRVGAYHEGARTELAALLEAVPVRPWLLDALDEAA